MKQFEKMRPPEKKKTLEKRSLKVKHNTSVFASEFVCFYFFFFLCQCQCGSYVVTPSVQKSTAATTYTLTGSLSRSGCVITLLWLWSSLKRKTKPAFFIFYSAGVCFSCWYFSKSLISDHFCSTLGSGRE